MQDINLYEQSFLTCFKQFYGNIDLYAIVGLLPGYLEKPNSSLVYMVQQLIDASKDSDSGFYLSQHQELQNLLESREAANKKTILFGMLAWGIRYTLFAYGNNGDLFFMLIDFNCKLISKDEILIHA